MIPGDIIIHKPTQRRGVVVRIGGWRVTVKFDDGTSGQVSHESIKKTGERQMLDVGSLRCAKCTSPPAEGKSMCEPCLEQMRIRKKLRRLGIRPE